MNPYETLLSEARGRPFAAIVGWPVELSRSPALHGFWLKQQAIDGHYGRLPVEPKREALAELLDQCERARVDVARPDSVRVAAPDLPAGRLIHAVKASVEDGLQKTLVRDRR